MLQIQDVVKVDLNEFDITFKAKPEPNETFSSVYLEWSTNSGFNAEKDSVFIPSTSGHTQTYRITGLKQATKYFGRIRVMFKGQKFYSSQREWITDTLKILDVSWGIKRGFNKGDTITAITNLRGMPPVQNTATKIFIGTYECPLVMDEGLTIRFSVPAAIPAGKYIFKILSKGMEAQAADSAQVLRGKWSYVTPPDIPVNPNAITKGLFSFGTCASSEKGYLLGGLYLNGTGNFPDFILEFDGHQEKWSKRFPAAPRYFENPTTYYYNNAIYVIAGKEYYYDQWGHMQSTGVNIRKMMKLDLGSLTWSLLDDMPYPTMFNMTTFEINQEWYIGMGADSANRSVCCGVPLPSKKFWKYSPVTNTWTSLADFPGGHQLNPTCFSIGKKGYAFYGAIPVGDPLTTTFTKELWEYNTETNTWSPIPLPSNEQILPKGEKYQIVTYNGKAYFLSGQVRALASYYYTYHMVQPFVEWDPVRNEFKPVSFPFYSDITKMIFSKGNTFYLQTDQFGYIENLLNKTYKFEIEQ